MNPSVEVTRQVLEETPTRALDFLRGVAVWKSIQRILGARGYTKAEHQLGWKLLLQCSSMEGSFDPSDQAVEVRAAIVELDAADEPLFRWARAALGRLHPEQAAFVFAKLEPATGMGAVVSMSTFLGRIDALEKSPEREPTRVADHAALATLDKRGLTKAERGRLAGLVAVAMAGNDGGADDEAADDAADQRRVNDLTALRAWYVDWAETARTALKRRDQLVRLGLARRRKASKEPEPPPEDPAAGEPAVPADV